jgi:hypothetical protein
MFALASGVLVLGAGACNEGAQGDRCNPLRSSNECNGGLVCAGNPIGQSAAYPIPLCPENYCCPVNVDGNVDFAHATSPYCEPGCNGGAAAICAADPADAETCDIASCLVDASDPMTCFEPGGIVLPPGDAEPSDAATSEEEVSEAEPSEAGASDATTPQDASSEAATLPSDAASSGVSDATMPQDAPSEAATSVVDSTVGD